VRLDAINLFIQLVESDGVNNSHITTPADRLADDLWTVHWMISTCRTQRNRPVSGAGRSAERAAKRALDMQVDQPCGSAADACAFRSAGRPGILGDVWRRLRTDAA
jgi:hypothetical protein